jgi:hypothetical protein
MNDFLSLNPIAIIPLKAFHIVNSFLDFLAIDPVQESPFRKKSSCLLVYVVKDVVNGELVLKHATTYLQFLLSFLISINLHRIPIRLCSLRKTNPFCGVRL